MWHYRGILIIVIFLELVLNNKSLSCIYLFVYLVFAIYYLLAYT